MIVRRAQNDPAHPALRDESINPLGWLGLRALGLIESSKMIFEYVLNRLILAGPRRIVQGADEQGLCRGISFFLGKHHGVAFRLLQNQQRNLEQWIGPAGDFDLAGELFYSAFLRDECRVQLRQRSRRFRTFAPRLIAAVTTPKTTLPIAAAKLGFTTWRAAAALSAARPVTARATALAGLVAEPALRLHTFIAGEFCKFVGLGFSLRPCGLEQVFQVQIEIRNVAHVINAPSSGVEMDEHNGC